MSNVVIFYVPVPNAEVGTMLGAGAVDMRLAACANLLGEMQSFYEWEGTVCKQFERPLLLKTLPELAQDLEQWLLQHHPYECPCILRLPPAVANETFYSWLFKQVG